MTVASPAIQTDGVTNGDHTKEEVNLANGQASADTASAEKLDVEAAVVEKPEYGPPEDMTLLKVRAARPRNCLNQSLLAPLRAGSPLQTAVPHLPALRLLSCRRTGAWRGRGRLSAGPEGCRFTQSLSLSVLTRATAPGAAQVQQIAMMKQELVINEKWTSVSEFNKVRAQGAKEAFCHSSWLWSTERARDAADWEHGPGAPLLMLQSHSADASARLSATWRSRRVAYLGAHKVFAVYQALPGPEATEIASYFGLLSHGRIGGLLTGLGFILPGARAVFHHHRRAHCRGQPSIHHPLTASFYDAQGLGS